MNTKQGNILIVDDNEELLVALNMYLAPHFAEIKTIKAPNLIPKLIESGEFDLVLLDMNFTAGETSGNEGFYWMNRILEYDPDAGIVFITAYGDIELAVRAMKEGATDFIQKSWDENKILSTLLSAYKFRQTKQEISKLKQKQKHLSDHIDGEYSLVTGRSEIMRQLMQTVEKVAGTEANILILGENGTGKEVLAREIHKRSGQSGEIFVPVDLGSLHENLFESELFGHDAGAFTDAKNSRAGRFEIANNGTIYLDEIGNIPLHLQSKLLSVIQNHEITRVGSSKSIPVRFRLICATNKPIYEMVEKGDFREDLLYRINTIQLDIPPLRERPEDIAQLSDFYLQKFSMKYNKGRMNISKAGMEKLKKYSWYGNIRELQNTIEKSVILADDDMLTPANIQIRNKVSLSPEPDEFTLDVHEKILITKALERFRGNISVAAKRLGINRSTLYEKIRKYDLQ
ncbi:MAG: sigma-54-dependent Fis family transcriptional regulator [Bacteroidales bacterium]|nr:sigma-54-dependent Fis family transcriptional regulator [Bacteroidales bacterium]